MGKGDLGRSEVNAFGPVTADRLWRISQGYKFGPEVVGPLQTGNMHFGYWEGKLTENLINPGSYLSSPVEADVNLLILSTDVSTYDEVKLELEGNEDRYLTVFNWNPFQLAFSGERVAGDWIKGQPRVLEPGLRALYGQAASTIAPESTGTVKLYIGDTYSGVNLTDVYNITDVDAEKDKRVEVTPDVPADRWVLKPLECPTGAGGSGSGSGSGSGT